jgi:hypothetical protein
MRGAAGRLLAFGLAALLAATPGCKRCSSTPARCPAPPRPAPPRPAPPRPAPPRPAPPRPAPPRPALPRRQPRRTCASTASRPVGARPAAGPQLLGWSPGKEGGRLHSCLPAAPATLAFPFPLPLTCRRPPQASSSRQRRARSTPTPKWRRPHRWWGGDGGPRVGWVGVAGSGGAQAERGVVAPAQTRPRARQSLRPPRHASYTR